MHQGSNRRLANVRTRSETGLEYVMNKLNIQTPFGKKTLKELKPFFPGEEEELRKEFEKMEQVKKFVENKPKYLSHLLEIFMVLKDISYTIERSATNALSVVELFEVKSFLLNMREIRQITLGSKIEFPSEFVLDDTDSLLDILDPRKDRINTFYIYDDFSEDLAEHRKEKKELEKSIRKKQKQRKEEIRKNYGINLTPKFDIVISRTSDDFEKAKSIADLEPVAEDYMSVTFKLAYSDEVYELVNKVEALNTKIEEEETVIREWLSKEVSKHSEVLLSNGQKIGRLDFVIAKVIYAVEHACVEPEIVEEHVVEIVNGRQLQVEDILKSKGKEYCPVSISLEEGVTCITGANMGGKTISLKLSGLVPIMAQYGLFVPCERAKVGLSNFMQILIGDSQSVERGLSSFGSEMEELKEILDHAQDRSLLLIDEIASGTNPVEGLALTRSLVDYLKVKPYIALITTHFEAVAEEREVKNMQVRGLADADFNKLDSELRYANRKERINVIGKYMDYRLCEVEENREIPKDALNIAKMLGINKEIIEGAQKYIK